MWNGRLSQKYYAMQTFFRSVGNEMIMIAFLEIYFLFTIVG